MAIVLYLIILVIPESKIEINSAVNLATAPVAFDPISFLIQVAIMIALSYALAPKPKRPKGQKPLTLEQFDIPTAEEGRPIQVLFGKKYVAAPNVVWFGHLKTTAVMG